MSSSLWQGWQRGGWRWMALDGTGELTLWPARATLQTAIKLAKPTRKPALQL